MQTLSLHPLRYPTFVQPRLLRRTRCEVALMSRGGRPQLATENRRQERAIYLSECELNAVKLRAAAAGRGLVSEVRLHPEEHAPDGHFIESFGELAAILELSSPRKSIARRFTGGLSVSLVAGVRHYRKRMHVIVAV